MLERFDTTNAAALDRRGFLKVVGAAGGGFALGWWPAWAAETETPAFKPIPPHAYVVIARDNTVEIRSNRLEMGQGTQTSLPMLLAEELDVPMTRVRATLAPAGDVFKDHVFGLQMTGGSTAVAHAWQEYRTVGATMRAMLINAAAELWHIPAERITAKDGYCASESQRASYGSLASLAALQPVPARVEFKNAATYNVIGKPQRRTDARAIADGSKRFGIDARLQNQTTVLIEHPPVFGARVEKFDASATLAIPGVLAVHEIPLARGETGLAVFARGYWPAKQGRDALQVQWSSAPEARVSSDGLLVEYRKHAAAPQRTALHWPSDAAQSAHANASKRIAADYEFPYLAHAPMEPLNCLIELKNGECTLWVGSQFQTVDRQAVADVLELDVAKVTLVTMPAGGGFGRRAVPTSDYVREAAQALKAWTAKGRGGPVKLMWSREDDIQGGYYRPMHVHRVDVGFDAAGQVASWDHVIVGQSILKKTPFERFMVKDGIDATMTEGVVENTYALPMRVRITHPEGPVPVLWWRSVGHTHTAFVMETMIDELARAANRDPVEYRLARFGSRLPRHAAALKLAVDKSGYGTRALDAGRAWGVAVHESFGSVVAYVAEVSVVDDRPVVHQVTAGVHCNRVVNPLGATAQIEGALIFGLSTTLPGNAITLKDGRVDQTSFNDYAPARIADAPRVVVQFVPSDEPPTGLGEPGTCVIAPAIANAVFSLTGKRLRKLPFDLKNAHG